MDFIVVWGIVGIIILPFILLNGIISVIQQRNQIKTFRDFYEIFFDLREDEDEEVENWPL